jgi:excisionase family DNA binding protein
MSKLLTAQDVADRLSIHVDTIRRWTREGKLKAFKFGDGIRCSVRYRESDIEEWIDSSAFPTGTEQPSDTSMA